MAGEHAVDWVQIGAWKKETGIELSEFETVVLIDMSREFVNMLTAAREPEYIAPNTDAVERSKPNRHAAAAAAYARMMGAADKDKRK